MPGARGPVIASALGSLPIGMYILAILLLSREATGSFAEAGRVAGAFGLANALGAVAQGRLMDRHGQPPVLRAAAAGHALAVAALVVAADRGAPSAVLVLCAVAGGACLPQVPAAMRSLWSVLVEDEERRQAAYAMVAIVFEVSVVAAPALVAGIIAIASPAAATAAAAVLASGAALGFASTRASRRWRGEAHAVGWVGPLAAPGVRTVFAVLGALGTAIGIVQVAVPAFTADGGSAETGGLLLAALSAGSLAGGLVYGARSWPGRPAVRLALMLAGVGAGCALLAAATSNLGARRHPARRGRAARSLRHRRLGAARRRSASGHGHRGVHGDDHGHRGRQRGGQRARRRDRRRPGLRAAALTAAAIAAAGAILAYARRRTLGTRSASTARSS